MADREEKGKVVPPRNNFKPKPVLKKATITDQEGAKPGYVRKWFVKDNPKHPSYYERKLERYAVGDPVVGRYWVEPWTVVRRDEAKPGDKRDDDTSGLDSALTHGDLVCLETTVENYAVIEEVERMQDEQKAKRIRRGDSEQVSGASYKSRVGRGDQFVSHRDLLNSPQE